MQKDVNSAGKAIQEMEVSVKTGNKASKEAEEAFRAIDASSEQTFALSGEIMASTEEQERSVNDTVKNIEKIVVVSEETASGTEQLAASSKDLSEGMDEVSATSRDLADVANQLLESVGKFKLEKLNSNAKKMTEETKEVQAVTLEEIKKQASSALEEKMKSGERLQLIIFKLAGEEYALPIDDIKEVVITPGIAKIPQTPDYIKGVANIRGNIIAIMDMEERLNLVKGNKENTGSYTLVIASEEFNLGILVKEVPNTLNTYSSEIDTASNIMQFSALEKECIKGVVKADDRLIILVDIFKLIEIEDLNKLITI